MRKILISIGIFMIGFAASCITFYVMSGEITSDRLEISTILGILTLYCHSKSNRN